MEPVRLLFIRCEYLFRDTFGGIISSCILKMVFNLEEGSELAVDRETAGLNMTLCLFTHAAFVKVCSASVKRALKAPRTRMSTSQRTES